MSRDVLLNYTFKLTIQDTIVAPSLAYLKKVLILVKPKAGVTGGTITACTSSAQIEAITDNADAVQLLNGGLSSIYVLAMADLDLETVLEATTFEFYTILVSSDFNTTELGLRDFGTFEGVIGYAFTDAAAAKAFGAVSKQCAFLTDATNKAKNMCFAFGTFLSSAGWNNQQYIEMPFNDGITDLGDAEGYFDDRISFVLTSPQYTNRLAFFVAGKKAIIAPYVKEEIRVSQQGYALIYINANKPQYTLTQAKLLQSYLQKKLDEGYVNTSAIDSGVVNVVLGNDAFIAEGDIVISEPSALWRLRGDLTTEI